MVASIAARVFNVTMKRLPLSLLILCACAPCGIVACGDTGVGDPSAGIQSAGDNAEAKAEASPAAPALGPATPAAPVADAPQAAEAARYTTTALRGRVVWTAEALRRRYGIDSDDDAAEASVSLETAEGELYPLVKDFRGRGFWLDARLRDVDLELVVRRFQRSPLVQVVRVYTLKEGRKYELDYWCDICAIPMYELKACECCQGPTRIRERPVEEAGQ